jgi:para-nitrobenzyl esterase
MRTIALILGLVLAVCAGGVARAQPGGSGPDTRIADGALRGEVGNRAVAFLGIPYARPPVGPLRWRAPQPPVPWRGVRDAMRFAPDCMQARDHQYGLLRGGRPSEDCLYLNVWMPRRPLGGRVPVVVWFHAEGLVGGGASMAVYDGSGFAGEDVVFVSVNYRLGSFGFFNHPALAAEAPGEVRGNYGYLDQIAALQWVQRNIRDFQGDPERVTIMAQGGRNGPGVVLLASPMARGLFHQAILVSSGYALGLDDLPPVRTLAEGEASARALARRLGGDGDGAAVLERLRAVPAATLERESSYAPPVVDGRLILEQPEAALLGGRLAPVPILAGAGMSSGDVGMIRSKEGLFAWFGPRADLARAVYDPRGDASFEAVARAVYADGVRYGPARAAVLAAARQGRPAYYYHFAYEAEARRLTRVERDLPPSASDIFFLFGNPAGFGEPVSPADEEMGRTMLRYWAAFVRTGVPNPEHYPRWPAFAPGAMNVMTFTPEGARAGPDPLQARLDLWQAHAEARLAR